MRTIISYRQEDPLAMVPEWLLTMLDDADVGYQVIQHRRDYTAEETAADTHTPRLEFAKTVLVRAGTQEVMLVLPAHHRVLLERVAEAMWAQHAELVTENRLFERFPDCEVGAVPPFGGHYSLPVIVAAPLAMDEHITFNAGSHDCAIRMRYVDFERLVRPRAVNFSAKAES
jgi:Ala-tRNA(Pro) deacylase